MPLVVLDTWEGPRAIAYGICGVCGWRGWGTFDIGLAECPEDPGAYRHDDPPECACPECTLHELAVHLEGDPDDPECSKVRDAGGGGAG